MPEEDRSFDIIVRSAALSSKERHRIAALENPQPITRYDPEKVVGEQWGRLTVIAHDHDDYQPKAKGGVRLRHFVKCECTCGNIVVVEYRLIKCGNTTSCGCALRDYYQYCRENNLKYNPNDVAGEVWGKLTILEHDHDKYAYSKGRRNIHHYVKCRCTCGRIVVCDYASIKVGNTRSCGKCVEYHKVHGLSESHIYKVYDRMCQRCYNTKHKNYRDYGGRGIFICDEWYTPGSPEGRIRFFKWALANGYDWRPLPNGKNAITIDRRDNDGPYSPDNCRWVDMAVQSRNRRNNTVFHDADGEILIGTDFDTKHGFPKAHFTSRVRSSSGWSEAAVVFEANHKDIGLCRGPKSGGYRDKDGFLVLIPTIERQQELYRREQDAKRTATKTRV